jgi:hypothetical protein
MKKFKPENSLPIFLLALFIGLGTWLSITLPVYPDEVTNLFVLDSLAKGETRWFVESCIQPNYNINEYYISQILQSVLGSLTTITSVFSLRVISFLIIALPTAYLFNELSKYNNISKVNMLLGLTLLLWPPIFINSFIYFRHEKFGLLFIIMCCLYSTLKYRLSVKKNMIMIVSVTITFLLAIYSHPKFLYLTPILMFIYGSEYLDWRRRASAAVVFISALLIFVFLFAYPAFDIGLNTWMCPGNSFIREVNKTYAVNPFDIIQNSSYFFNMLQSSFDDVHIGRYFFQLTFQVAPDIGYLPSTPSSFGEKVNPILHLLWGAVFLSFCTAGLLYIRRAHYFIFILCALNLTILILQLNRAAYDVAFFCAAGIIIYLAGIIKKQQDFVK